MSKSCFHIYLIILLANLISSQDDVIFSKESGFYTEEFLLTLSTSSGSSKIFYTIDGTNPTNSTTTKEYKDPIQIIDRSQEPNIYSNYEEDMDSPYSLSYNKKYKKPPFPLEKAMVIRAASKNGDIYGNVTSKTYFITKAELSQFQRFTVISLVTDPDNLFDADRGIMVLGNLFMEYKKSGKYDPDKPFDFHKECNYCSKGSDWEREVSMSFFVNGELTIDQNVGIRIKGQSTRDMPQKSFSVYARKKYGKKKMKSSILFPNNTDINGNPIKEYDSLCLRAVSDDDRDRDLFINNLLKYRYLTAYMEMKECFLFLNGELWGMYVITEKYSEEYFASHYNLPNEDAIFYTKGDTKEDTPQEVIDLFNFMDTYAKKDLSNKDNYIEVSNFIDIDSIIEHYSVGIYFSIIDWPNNNYGLWKYSGGKIDGNEYSDGKWRFLTYDYDFTMGHSQGGFKGFDPKGYGYEYDMFTHVDSSKQRHPTNL